MNFVVLGVLLSGLFGLTSVSNNRPSEFLVSEMQPQESFKFRVSNPDHQQNQVNAQLKAGQVILSIQSSKIAGTCTITPEQGKWPDQVTMVLNDFQELEGFELTMGRMHAQGSRRSSGKFTLSFLDDNANSSQRSAVGTLDINVEQRPEGIAVIFPKSLFTDANAVKFHWVQVYLN